MSVTFVMICNACDIYVVIWGPLYVKNKKKDLFGHFAMCQGLGTRQSDHFASLNSKFAVCQDRAHGELTIVRRVLGKRHTANLNTLPCAKAQGTWRSGKFCRVPTSWHTAKSSVTSLGCRHDVNAFFLPCTLGYIR